MVKRKMIRRRFLAKLASAAGSLALLGLGMECGATPTPEATEKTVAVEETPTPAWKAPGRILFIGNSLSSGNYGVETHVKSLAASRDPPLTIETSSATKGDASLKDHYENVSLALDKIREGDWDVVVLQGHFSIPVTDEEAFYEYARKLDEEIQKASARTVFFMHWGLKGARAEGGPLSITTESVARAYESIAAELGARVVPVGLAWQRSVQENPDLNVYYRDARFEAADPVHPSMHGTYLTACVFYATLFRQSPVGLSHAPEEITEEERTFLQRMAWETVQEYR